MLKRVFLLAALLSSCAEAEKLEQNVAIAGSDEVVVPSAAFACASHDSNKDGVLAADIPDAPPRMFRRSDGRIVMIAAHHSNIPWFSADGRSFTRAPCRSILSSGINGDPAQFDNRAWITGFYTKNGRDVFALVHNEYHGGSFIPACRRRLAPGQAPWDAICLQISMRGYVSRDGGQNFRPLAVDSPVLAATNDRVEPSTYGSLTRVGLHDPSNIVRNPKDGYFYFLVLADPSPRQERGTCAFRSKDPLTQPWFAWDGTSFSTRMGSPYAGKGNSCKPVKPWGTYLPAVSWNTELNKFLAIGRGDRRKLVAVTSPDLIHWDREIDLRDSVQTNWWKPFAGNPDPDSYYTLFDPTSTSRFFDTTGKNPYIYFVKWHTSLTKVASRTRDIVRVRLRVGQADQTR